MAQRYFLTAESTYEDLRQYLNTQLKYPNSLGKSIFQTALQAPRDNYRRILLAVDTSIANYDAVTAAIAPLLDSDAMEEVDEATYLAAVSSATAGVATWGEIADKPSTFAPSAHKSSHATGGTDALTPADIGASAVGHAHSAMDTTSGVFDLARIPYPIAYPVRAVNVGGVLTFNNGAYYTTPTYGTAGADIADMKTLATMQFPATSVAVDVSANATQYTTDNPGRTLTYASLEVALIDAANRIVGWGATSTNAGLNPPNGTAGTSMTISLLSFPTLSNVWILGGGSATGTNTADIAPISAYKYCQSRFLDIEKTDWANIPNKPTFATVATSGSAADLTGTLAPARLPATTVTAGSYGSASSVATFTVDAAGRLTAAGSTSIAISAGAVSGLATVATSGSYNDLTNKPTIPSAYTLPTASATVLGGVKIGSGISIDGSGVISASAGYTLPNATTTTLGGVIVGTGLGVTSGTVSVTYGTTSGTACQGNDSRLTDTRTPTDGSVTDAKITSGGLSASSINWAAIADWQPSTAYAKGDLVNYLGVAYRRSAAGTSGTTFTSTNWQQVTPSTGSTSSTLCIGNDSRLSDSRTPTAHATSHNPGGSDAVSIAETYEFTRSSKPASASGSGGSYTWSIPAAAKTVEFLLIAGGGGGGSGRRGAAGTARYGGGGGGSGSVTILTRRAAELLSRSLTITVGAGGTGGAAVTADDTNGNNAAAGSSTNIFFSGNTDNALNADRGGGGSGGTAAAGNGGGGGSFASYAGIAGSSSSVSATPSGSNPSSFVAGGGGAGGGISTGDASQNGAIARAQGWMLNSGPSGHTNSSGGTAPGGSGQSASAVFTQVLGAQPGGSGGGGAAGNSTTAGGAGGDGANYGGGGGGGGASFNGYASGKGGNGGDGYVRITVYY